MVGFFSAFPQRMDYFTATNTYYSLPLMNHSLLMFPNNHFIFYQKLNWDLDEDSYIMPFESDGGASVNLEQHP